MKGSMMRVMSGLLGLGLVAAVGSGCTQHVPIPADQMARLEAGATSCRNSSFALQSKHC
jgi:hypothetical protein